MRTKSICKHAFTNILFTYSLKRVSVCSCKKKQFDDIIYNLIYEGELIIIRNAVAFVFLLAALSFSHASLGLVFFLSQLYRFEIVRSVPLLQP